MAVALRSSSKAGNAAAVTSFNLAKPAGTVDGDFMLLWIGYGSVTSPAAPSGWTLVEEKTMEGSQRSRLYYKWASGEPANYSIPCTSGIVTNAIASSWTGVHLTNPIGSYRSYESKPSGLDRRKDFDPVWAGWTDGALAAFSYASNNTQTAPAGYTKVEEQGLAGSGSSMIAFYQKTAAPAKGYMPKATWTSSSLSPQSSFHVFLRPAGVFNQQPTIVGHNFKGQVAAGSPPPMPPFRQAGDLLILAVTSHNATALAPLAGTGWTKWRQASYGTTNNVFLSVWYRVATNDASDVPNFTWSGGGGTSAEMVCYRLDVAGVPGAAQSTELVLDAASFSTSHALPSITTLAPSTLLLITMLERNSSLTTITPPAGMTLHYTYVESPVSIPEWPDMSEDQYGLMDAEFVAAPGATGTRTFTVANNSSGVSFLLAVPLLNIAPLAPTDLAPAANLVIDRSIGQRFSWNHFDPNLDAQFKFDLDYRVVGAGVWTTITTTTPNQYHDFAANALANLTSYEWRVRTYDPSNLPGPYSAIEFFSTATGPAAPSITAPVNAGTVPTLNHTLTWTVASQTHYQVRKLGDLAGVADTGTVYFDSGEVANSGTRSLALTYPVNGRWEHVQVRIKNAGLWSPWASVRVFVSYTLSPLPTLVVTADPNNGRITVVITNPAPSGGQPAFVSGDLVRSTDNVTFERIATGMSEDATYQDYAVTSDTTYYYRALVYGDNDTLTSSISYAAALLNLKGTWIHDPDDPAGTIHQFIYNDNAGDETWASDHALSKFAGRVHPFSEFGTAEEHRLSIPLALEEDLRGDFTALKLLTDLKKVVLVRDGKGRKLYATLPNWTMTPSMWGGRMTLEVTAVDYVETV